MVTQKVKNQLASPIQANKLRVISEVRSTNGILADNDYLKIIIRNLLSNAIKYSNMETQIDILVDENDGASLISIIDQGVGIKEGDISKLFTEDESVHDIKNSDKNH